mmetsp:Transcript_19345/g.68419  ORF Transcript_19345/g.68419 Transcript_19345/m.68419 type:complete len:231 (+) Transcript_19345:2856-3548(+)
MRRVRDSAASSSNAEASTSPAPSDDARAISTACSSTAVGCSWLRSAARPTRCSDVSQGPLMTYMPATRWWSVMARPERHAAVSSHGVTILETLVSKCGSVANTQPSWSGSEHTMAMTLGFRTVRNDWRAVSSSREIPRHATTSARASAVARPGSESRRRRETSPSASSTGTGSGSRDKSSRSRPTLIPPVDDRRGRGGCTGGDTARSGAGASRALFGDASGASPPLASST